jgi:hypothetical protein
VSTSPAVSWGRAAAAAVPLRVRPLRVVAPGDARAALRPPPSAAKPSAMAVTLQSARHSPSGPVELVHWCFENSHASYGSRLPERIQL